jgi:hypothetical protein
MSPYDLIHLTCEPKTPWIVSLLYFGTRAFCALLTYLKNTLILRQHHIERMASLEKGLLIPQLPSEFFQDARRTWLLIEIDAKSRPNE